MDAMVRLGYCLHGIGCVVDDNRKIRNAFDLKSLMEWAIEVTPKSAKRVVSYETYGNAVYPVVRCDWMDENGNWCAAKFCDPIVDTL